MNPVVDNYEQFESEAVKYFEEKYADKVVEVCGVVKNNGIEKRYLMIRTTGEQMSPAICLESCYEAYLQDADMKKALGQMEEGYLSRSRQNGMDVGQLYDFEKMKEYIRILLVNEAENQTLLAKTPHIKILDLALVCCIKMPLPGDEEATIWVYQLHMECWGVSKETVFEVAFHNSIGHMPYRLLKMPWLACELPEDVREEGEGDCSIQTSPWEMHILTNLQKKHGAAAMLYPDVLSECAAHLGTDLYILPSSIHEVILLAADYENEPQLTQMVREVNDEHVQDEEILSYHVYRYSRKDNSLEDVVTRQSVALDCNCELYPSMQAEVAKAQFDCE